MLYPKTAKLPYTPSAQEGGLILILRNFQVSYKY